LVDVEDLSFVLVGSDSSAGCGRVEVT